MGRLALSICVITIFVVGVIMIFSTTSAEVLDHDLDRSTSGGLVKQLLYALGGGAIAWVVFKKNYTTFLKSSPEILCFLIALLVLVLVPGIGREVNGSKRWIGIGGFSFQPSEFVKYAVPAYFIHKFGSRSPDTMTFKDLARLIALPAVAIVLILVEPNNGTAAVVCMTLLVLLFLTRIPFKFWAFPLLAFVLIGGVFAANLPYVQARLKVYLHPELDLKGKGHQPYQAKIAAGSGGLLGRGPGNSLQKLSYLPEAQNDYIAAIYAEEFGFLGMISLIALYMIVACMGFQIAYTVIDPQAFYLASAITFLISFQAFLNLGVVSGLLPSTGLNLPLFSQGGSSLMASIMGIALLINISSYKNETHPLLPWKK